MSEPAWMIYGANGYTGRLTAREAAQRGQRPVLAGRSLAAIEPLAKELNCPFRVFPLDDPGQIAAQLAGVHTVVHCAGPFSATAAPMMQACLRAKANYLDITGEIDVIEAGAQLDQQALAAGITIMPAVGFDVVPSDCLAAILKRALPDATHLQLAFLGLSGLSPGTAKTMVENLPRGGRARIDGHIVPVPPGWKSMEVRFASGLRPVVTIPWGDVASAYYSTGIPNIETYAALPRSQVRATRWLRWIMPLAGLGVVQRLLKRRIEATVPGPNEQELKASRSSLWGRVTNAAGASVEATLETPGGYPLTVATTLAVLEQVLAGKAPAGFSTPAKAFGADFILTIPGTALSLVDASVLHST
ncbi:MAG: saccharopine dehydrogenase NADP-binding domain-containing protein [Pirellulales bacterium]|nr:saccharopine dehydrogenase NADP-binding domain-containing protein [Pirellulales bacterium]